MKESRRQFVRKSAYLTALSAIGMRPDEAAADPRKKRTDEAEWMDVSIAHWNPQQKQMNLAKQMGVTGAVSGAGRDPAARKQEFEDAGLRWTVCEGVRLDRAQLGIEGRDEDIENFVELIEKCAEVGQDVICYNWMPVISWARTDMAEAMQAYYDVGFRGPVRPDHVPTTAEYEENERPGYNDLGTLFAIGYIKGLMEAVAESST